MTGPQVLIQIAKTSEIIFGGLAVSLNDHPLTRTGVNGNHALWCVGHAVVSDHSVIQMVGGEQTPRAAWDALFQFGTTPSDDASVYPDYAEVLAAFTQSRAALIAHLSSLSDADLDQATQGVSDESAPFFGTHGKALSMVCWHPMQHAGQLSVIRKNLGMAPAMM